MKKKLLPLLTAFFFSFALKSQYASIWSAYPPAYEVSAGFSTHHTPGTFWLGYLSTVQNSNAFWHSNKNFCIMGTGASSIWGAYQIFESSGCNNSFSQVAQGNGISAIETLGPNNLRYALAGVYNKACYFITLGAGGNVISSVSYPFPSLPGGQYPLPGKPLIVESNQASEYYFCGYFESQIYVINVSASGAVLWSSFYTLGNNAVPKDLIMNPFKPGELVIVGETRIGSKELQGFVLELNGHSGNVVSSRMYGNTGVSEGFATIVPITNSKSNAGFILGGYSEKNSAKGASTAWVMKTDLNGSVVWSNLLAPSIGANRGIIDMVERENTLSDFEYYALLNSNAGMQVLKLDKHGLPFQSNSLNAQHNEFVYDLPAVNPSRATSISYVNAPASTADVGIQVFGTASNFTGFSSSYVVSAYFNGETNCYRTLSNQLPAENGVIQVNNLPANKMGGLSACTQFQVLATFPGGSLNYPCSGFMTSGSNQREMPSGINPEEEAPALTRVFPNPTEDRIAVAYYAPEKSKVTIALYNLLGQLVAQTQPHVDLAGNYEQELNLKQLGLEKGVYFVCTTINQQVHKQKIILTR